MVTTEGAGQRCAVDLHDYLRVLRKRWRLVALCTLLAIGAAALVTWRTTPTYQASAQLFVAARDNNTDVSGLNAGGQFSQQRVKSYADIIDSPQVTAAVAARVGGGLTAGKIAKE